MIELQQNKTQQRWWVYCMGFTLYIQILVSADTLELWLHFDKILSAFFLQM